MSFYANLDKNTDYTEKISLNSLTIMVEFEIALHHQFTFD